MQIINSGRRFIIIQNYTYTLNKTSPRSFKSYFKYCFFAPTNPLVLSYDLSILKNSTFSLRAKKLSLSKEEQIQFILEGFPNIGPAKAKKLIEKFKSIKNIISASEEELELILGKKAKEFKSLVD